MSTIHVHIGQCGNQLSIPLWKTFLKSENDSRKALLTSLDGKHRSIHIDSEYKVISSIPKSFRIRDKNVIIGKRGRGTNFALGYYGLQSFGDDHLLHDSMEAIRKEVERCDMYTGAVVYHSLSGGTGSGFGARVTESLRDYYPSSHILSSVVAPCASGESPLQNFNALLALHHFHMFTDAIILLQNDFYLSCVSKKHEDSTTQSGQISFQNINEAMANALCGIFLPTETLSVKKHIGIGQEPWELVKNTTPMPSSKFITLANNASTKLSWEGITSKLLHSFPRYNSSGLPNRCINATVVGRGDVDYSFESSVCTNLEHKIKKALNFVTYSPYPLDCWSARNCYTGPKKSASVTLAANSSGVQDYLERVILQSHLKLESRAYVHWYHKYGVSEELFHDSIESLQNVTDTYTELTKS